MKRTVIGVVAASTLLAAGYFGVRMTEPKPTPVIARATVNNMSATAKVGATKEEKWPQSPKLTTRPSNEILSAIAERRTASASRQSSKVAPATSASKTTTSQPPVASLQVLATDPYRYSMTDPNAGSVKECAGCPNANSSAVAFAPAISTTPGGDTPAPNATPRLKSLVTSVPSAPKLASTILIDPDTTTAATTPPFPAPPKPEPPPWTRCTTSWALTLAAGDHGVLAWTFTTTLSAVDIQDFTTAVHWYEDIKAEHADVAADYAWIDCSAFHVRDYREHGKGQYPPSFFGAQGLDSPLGTCHSKTPTQREYGFTCSGKSETLGCSVGGAISTHGVLPGTLGADGKLHGWVIWPGGGMYEGTIADVECANGCTVEFDHPCTLPNLNVQPGWARGKDGNWFGSWWVGGNPDDPKEREMWGVKP